MKIIKAGILDTVQDIGRYGFQHLGINPGGVMDLFAASIANFLVGNDANTAVIELHFPASVFWFDRPSLISISGADFGATLNGEPIPIDHAVWTGKNSLLQFNRNISGARCYLAISGGFRVEQWMGSRSTNMRAGAGGYQGRALQKNDEIIVDEMKRRGGWIPDNEFVLLPWKADTNWGDEYGDRILILPGIEWHRLTEEGKESFFMTSFMITHQSDRMGYRLNNLPLPVLSNEEILSSGVDRGTVQLLPDGKLIILMADHQTTGGYPRIAHVIAVHQPKLAQMKPGERILFQEANQATAEKLWMKQQQHLLQLQNACTFRLEAFKSKYG